MPEFITPNTLKELVAANAVRSAEVLGEKGGYIVLVKYGMIERVVAARDNKGHVKLRTFSSLDSAGNFLRNSVHIVDYQVKSANFEPAPPKARYAKNAERLKEAHAALSHNEWLQKKVEASRAGLADGSNKRIAPDDWENIRVAKRAQRDAL